MSINISCDDTEDMEYQVNCVKYKVHNNNPIAHMSIWDGGDTPVIAINDYETTFYTKSYSTELIVTCKEDKKATITIQESTLKSPLSGFKPDNIRLAHNPSC